MNSDSSGAIGMCDPQAARLCVGDLLTSGSRRELGKPGIEDLQLVLWRIEEGNTHANSLVDVENSSFCHERAFIAGNLHIEQRSRWKYVQDVNVTSSAANFRDPP